MKHFAAYSPTLGLRKDFPSILLDKAFTPDAQNIQYWNGEIRSAKMRRKEFLRDSHECTVVGNDTLLISGDKTAQFPDGCDVLLYSEDGEYAEVFKSVQVSELNGSTIIHPDASSEATFGAGERVIRLTAGMSEDPTAYAFGQVPMPDGNPVIRHHSHITDDGTEYAFAFTKRNVYLWTTVSQEWLCVFTATGDCEWSSASFHGYLIITNDLDRVQVWSGRVEANSFSDLDTTIGPGVYISQAKFVTEFENHVILGNYVLSNGEDYTNGIIFSDLDDHTNWRQDQVNDAGALFVEGKGALVGGFGRKGSELYVFKDSSVRIYWYTATDLVFASRAYERNVGTICPDSIVNDKDGNLYFYASDLTFREVDLGIISRPINEEARMIVQTTDILSKMRGTYIAEYEELWWAVPYGADATGNNRVFCYKNGVWSQRIMDVSAFGTYRQDETWTWDTLPFASWDEWDWPSWDSPAAVSDWPIDLASDYTGFVYNSHGSYSDKGQPVTAYFVLSTDLADLQAMRWFKRLLAMYLVIQKSGSEALTVEVKRDNEPYWQPAGTVTVASQANDVLTERVSAPGGVDFRAKRFQIKVSSTSSLFRFLGIEFDYVMSGER